MNAPAPTSHALLIVDDHPVYREALGEALSKDFAPLGIDVKTASNASEGMSLVSESSQSWLVLLDVLMPGLSGLAGIKVFKSMPNVAHVVSISGLDADVWEPRAVAAGSTLFLSKNNTSAVIFKKIYGLYNGVQGQNVPNPLSTQSEYRLTQRQLEVLTLISMGHPNKIIADLLDIKEQTVKIHINQIFKELRVFNRTQAVLKAQKLLLTATPPQA
ncbi:response regulator transcription factor [Limnohabitans sp. 15K]|uniref:response regulator transcription factor n=1 Tax=Limnohabitans sp. 15K TaxID=1100706 RepID=UPI00130437A6|nr:response regulator transcription factor [Limnohabitans sp. 15K]